MTNPNAGETDQLPPDVREGLATLFLWWYGNHFQIRRILRCEKNFDDSRSIEMRLSHIEDAWRTRWFAKGDEQISVDLFIKENFAWLLDDAKVLQFSPKKLWEKMAFIILFDQVTRNALRGTARAYAYDCIALPMALELMDHSLPFQFQATVAICLCHSESLAIQLQLDTYLSKIAKESIPFGTALLDIARKHHERIAEFGRFPERNKALQRNSTPREDAYLSQLR